MAKITHVCGADFTLNESEARNKKVGGQFKVREGIVFRAKITVSKIAKRNNMIGSSHRDGILVF